MSLAKGQKDDLFDQVESLFLTRDLNVGLSFETTACASLDYKLVHTKETLTKEQAKIASNVSNEGIEVIQPVLK